MLCRIKPVVLGSSSRGPLGMMLGMRDCERALLGAMLHDESAIAVVEGVVQPDCFGSFEHQAIYLGLRAAREPDGLVAWLSARGLLGRVGGAAYIDQLLDGVPGAANVLHWAKAVHSAM